MPLFTRDNAREMSARGNRARWHPPAVPTSDSNSVPRVPDASGERAAYTADRLARVRAQLDMLDTRISNVVASMTAKPDPANPVNLSALSKELKELVDAQTRLSEQERVLDGRPAPGQLRPTAQRSAPRPVGGLAPRAAEPAPESPPTPPPA